MTYLLCVIIGYAVGCLSPAYLLSKIKKKDIRKSGTGNLGGTNTMVNFGKKWGILVMLFDILKALFVIKLCEWLFPTLLLAGAIAGTAAIFGHIFPFYLHFQGGKGLACLGGFILSVDWKYFVLILIIGIIVSIIINYGCGIPFTAAIVFPFIYFWESKSVVAFLIILLASSAIIYKHVDNVLKIRAGEEMSVRDFYKKKIGKQYD